ncbi:MAG TPA: Ig-like domain-containing protein, partial [Holophagaceae bacterium]|nr:Ig-like domain-containing protein [Holophagaceae bacterium]
MTPSKRLTTLLVAGAISATLFAERPASGMDRVLPRGKAQTEAEQDDATARRAAMREWLGDYTPEYRQFLLGAAQRERERWGDLIPGSGHVLPAKAAGNHWTNLGPTTASYEWNGSTYSGIDSGRPVAIVVDPTDANIIYNATSGGGVWKTTDGGSTWSPITESLGSLSIGHLAMDPNNHNTLYLGLGDAFDGTGIGLVKSTDGGATWSSVVYLGSTSIINHISVSSTNSQIVMAATNAGLYRSTDGGASFSLVTITTGWGGDPYCWDIAWGGGTNWAMTLEGSQFTATTTGSGQIWYSTDDGATWTKATGFSKSTGVARASIASAPSSRTTMYAMAAVYNSGNGASSNDLADFFKSTDGGHTWTALGVTSTKQYSNTNTEDKLVQKILNGQGWYNHFLAVDPSTSTTFYAGGALLLCQVTGATTTPVYTQKTNWLAQFSLPYVHADFHAGTFDQNGVLYVGTDGGIFKRTAAGSPDTWSTSLNVGITSHLAYSVGSSLNNTSAVITGLQDNGTRVRSGSTSTFDQPLGGDGFGCNINASNATLMLGSLYYDAIYKSTTSGSTGGSFSSATSGITEANNSSSAPFITRLTPWAGDATGNTVLTFANLKVYKTTTYAGSWSALGTSGLLVSSGAVSASGNIRNVGIAKTDSNVVGVVASGGRVYTTTNGGSTWTEMAGLESGAPTMTGSGGYLSYISFSPQNSSVVYVASVNPSSTANHLWKSSNGGSTWASLDGSSGSSNGFPFGVPVNTIVEDPGDSQTLYAGTHEGLYRSTDGGSTWSRFGAGLPLVNVTDVYLAPDSSLLRVSTFGRGIWEFNTLTSTVSASITTPASNQTISSGTNVSFTGTATDQDPASTLSYGWNFGDGATATGASTNHTFTNSTGSDVIYTVTFTATGSTGGLGSTTRSITVHPATSDTTPPTGSFDVQKGGVSVAGTTTSGTLTFTASASDGAGSGVQRVTFYIDGAFYKSIYSAPYTTTWNSALSANGNHTVLAYAKDNAGNMAYLTPTYVKFTTSNADIIPPTGTISVSGTSGTISFNATASDVNGSVARVTFYVDGVFYKSLTTAPYTVT